MTAPIFAVAAADADVRALLGESPTRLFPFGEADLKTPMPYAVWQVIAGSPENYLAGRPDTDSYTLQVDVYAGSATEVRAVKDVLVHAIELDCNIVAWNGETRDRETKIWRVGFDVDWIVLR